jgi:hypothetical protein
VEFVRADSNDPTVAAPEAEIISNHNLSADRETRREVTATRIRPTTHGDPLAIDVAGASPVPETVSVPRVEISDNETPLRKNRDDPSRPGARSGGQPERSLAEAQPSPKPGAPGGQAEQRIASKGGPAIPAKGVRETGASGVKAPTRDGLALAIDGEFPLPSTGGADPADPRPEGPDLPSRSDRGIRPLFSPGTLAWVTSADSADGGQTRSEVGETEKPAPRVGEGETGEGQTRQGEGTGIAEANPGLQKAQNGSRAAAGGTGSARTDRSLVIDEAVELDIASALNAVETPLGRYAALIDQALRDGWAPPIEDRVMSGYCVTTVTFRVDVRGRVSDKDFVRLCGVEGLDDAAFEAVPERVPRPNNEVLARGEHLTVTYSFRHSSPIVSRSAPR